MKYRTRNSKMGTFDHFSKIKSAECKLSVQDVRQGFELTHTADTIAG